jgi:hypothetical protein
VRAQIFLHLKYYSSPTNQVRPPRRAAKPPLAAVLRPVFALAAALKAYSRAPRARCPPTAPAQRYIIRLLLMVPIYSSMSACALHVGLPQAIYYETARDWCARATHPRLP